MMQFEFALGRRVPTDWRHVERYPYEAVAPATVAQVERALDLPDYRHHYDQGREGACVGYGSSWMMSILNRRRYSASWLWREAKKVDEWPETLPEDNNGTSVRAAIDILRTIGHVRTRGQRYLLPAIGEGIVENRWATSVDQVRTCIASGVPVTLGTNWYTNFDRPVKQSNQWWIGAGDLGNVRGGHAVCIYRASDHLQAVGLVNSWGNRYPLVLLPYRILERLLSEYGEATMVTDRVA